MEAYIRTIFALIGQANIELTAVFNVYCTDAQSKHTIAILVNNLPSYTNNTCVFVYSSLY
jgi:hypothetical protein